MKYMLVLLAVLFVSGCAQVRVLSESDRSVVVEGKMEDWARTQPAADAACAKRGLKARFKYNTEGFPSRYFYDCVD